MKRFMRMNAIMFVAGTVLVATGCVVHEYGGAPEPGVAVGGEVVVNEPPPAPVEETVIAAPGPGFIWIGGFWGWNGGHWHWERGHWARPPHHGAVWVAPHYYHRGGRHVWVHGGWK